MGGGSDDLVRVAIDGGVATIELNRPERLNAITFAMRDRLVEHLEAAAADPAVAVMVLRGAGRAFTSGVDVEDRPDLQDPTARRPAGDLAEIEAAARAFERLWALPKPVIVKAHGYCVGWGLEIALHADIVLASEDCEFFFPSVANGSGLPDSMTAAYHLGPQWAKRLLLAGDRIDGRTAARIGLVSEALPEADLDGAVARLARQVAALPAEQVAQTKAVLNRAVDLLGRPAVGDLAARANAVVRAEPGAGDWSRRVREQGRHAAGGAEQPPSGRRA